MYDEHISRDPKIFTVYLKQFEAYFLLYEIWVLMFNNESSHFNIGTRAHDIPLVEKEQISVTSWYISRVCYYILINKGQNFYEGKSRAQSLCNGLANH